MRTVECTCQWRSCRTNVDTAFMFCACRKYVECGKTIPTLDMLKIPIARYCDSAKRLHPVGIEITPNIHSGENPPWSGYAASIYFDFSLFSYFYRIIPTLSSGINDDAYENNSLCYINTFIRYSLTISSSSLPSRPLFAAMTTVHFILGSLASYGWIRKKWGILLRPISME